jgi:hypothetical protein
MRFAIPVLVTFAIACTGPAKEPPANATAPDCKSVGVRELPAELSEISGIAASPALDGIFWVHNDDGPPLLYALDTAGTIKARVQVPLRRNRDWEDIAAGPCADGYCLYIGDIGDNKQRRNLRTIFRIVEPALSDTLVDTIIRYQFRTPGKSHDAEAIVVLPDDELYLVTKGRSGPIMVFAFPKPPLQGTVMELTEVARLSDGLVQLPEMVTGAAVVPGTRIVAVRTYGGIQFYHARNGTLQAAYERSFDLKTLNEPQGEGVTVRADGSVFLVSERAIGKAALLSRVQCVLPK